MESLENLIKQLENNVVNWSTLNPEISKASVGWHIEHALLTTDAIIKAVEVSKPEKYKAKFSFAKFFVFTFNKLPRGKIESPKSVRPEKIITIQSLKNHFETSYHSIKKLGSFSKDNYFKHPFFGDLNLRPAIKFLRIHTKHHLGIINDILKKSN